MKLEYFAEGSQDCPLILIYGDEKTGALNLSLALNRVAIGAVDFVDVQNIANFDAVNGCQLRIQFSKHEAKGVQMTDDNQFVWTLSSDECEDVIGLLEPFSKKNDGEANKQSHQFLEQNGEIRVIFSTERRW
ncbi:hypothetical protein [Candidatus Leptofilum sp.]|uniref:hypothetical protein n=1 Tax=Candidatus Leptofilum sp. TaxID=3241576 RepID=UPI003B599E04